jgi:hypothetical protein
MNNAVTYQRGKKVKTRLTFTNRVGHSPWALMARTPSKIATIAKDFILKASLKQKVE